jgi:hypothetical protein
VRRLEAGGNDFDLCSLNPRQHTLYSEASARVFAAWCVTRRGWPCEQLDGRGQPYI